MPVSVKLQTVHPRKLAAVRREVPPGGVGSAWGPALDKVWEFIRGQPGLRTDGHNIFLYHHPTQPGAPILCDFGVERDARRDQKMDGGDSEGVRWALVGDIRRSDAGSG